jgi:hypothetical protein
MYHTNIHRYTSRQHAIKFNITKIIHDLLLLYLAEKNDTIEEQNVGNLWMNLYIPFYPPCKFEGGGFYEYWSPTTYRSIILTITPY